MHVVAKLDAVATESHFFSTRYLSCQRFVELVTLGEKEVRDKEGKKSHFSVGYQRAGLEL